MLANCIPLAKECASNYQNVHKGIVVNSSNLNAVELTGQLKIELNTIPTASGSALIELSGVKIICSIRGPFPLQRGGFNDVCQLECDVKYSHAEKIRCGSSNTALAESGISTALINAISPIICLDKYPKAVISVNVIVLQRDDSESNTELSAAIMGCSLALASAGIQMYNLLNSVTIACSKTSNGYEYLINPCMNASKSILGSLVLATSSTSTDSEDITQIYSQGRIPVDRLLEMMDIGSVICNSLYLPMQRQCLKNYASKSFISDN